MSAERFELTGLVARYAAAVDRCAWAALGSLFTEDAVLVTPDGSMLPTVESAGRDAIVSTVRTGVADFVATLHHLTGSTWDVEGGEARGRTTSVAHHLQPGRRMHVSYVWHVEYADTCVRTGSTWQFTRRELTVRMMEQRPLTRILPRA